MVRRPPRAGRHQPRDAGELDHGADRSVGLREVHVPPDPEPDARARARAHPWRARSSSTASTSTRRDVRATDVRRRIGMVFQKPNPFPAMTIAENVAVRAEALRASRRRRSDARRRGDLPRARGLWNEVKNRLDDPGGALSGGQQQRLCIARSLAVQPASPADGRAVLGARPDLDAPHRGDDARARRDRHDRDRHAQHAAGAAGLDQLRVLHRRRGRAGRHRRDRARPSRSSTIPTTPAPRTTCTEGSDERRSASPAVGVRRVVLLRSCCSWRASPASCGRSRRSSAPVRHGHRSRSISGESDVHRYGSSVNYQGVGSTHGSAALRRRDGRLRRVRDPVPVPRIRRPSGPSRTCRTSPAAPP